ncbi:hypothetical protein [Kitasatospora sp. NPDC059599]|uniref:hypothetical protein n=1 Tax=Kitasatospora sp. NPDC059599 TaxID=3346880 RepID=UPI0036BD221B
MNDAIAAAGETGRRAAAWVRELAERQSAEGHRAVLEQAADAIEQTAGREIVPGGEGQPDDELRYALTAGLVTGNPYSGGRLLLATGERIALVSVCALAAAMPRTVLCDLERELSRMDAAVSAVSSAAEP